MHTNWKTIKAGGTRFISINPQYTETDKELNAEWVKIIPNTDTALFLAMSYHVYVNNMHDQDYLDKYTSGFDKFLPYLPAKTPLWASEITGISETQIIELAELFASKRTQFAGGWAIQRADHGEMIHWAIINFAAMVGKIGKPGEGVGFSWHYGSGGMPQSGNYLPSSTYLAMGRNPVTTFCPASRITEMLLNPGASFVRNGGEYVYPNTKLIYQAGGNFVSHQQDTNELIGALNQQVETFICQDDPTGPLRKHRASSPTGRARPPARGSSCRRRRHWNGTISARVVITATTESMPCVRLSNRLKRAGTIMRYSDSLAVSLA